MHSRQNYTAVLLIALTLALSGCGAPAQDASFTPAADEQGPTPSATVPIQYTAAPAHSCKARGPLPDPVCTPGKTNPNVTQANIQQTICVRGWTDTVRPKRDVTDPIKTERLNAYGMPKSIRSRTELDHLIPLELGGATGADPTDIVNLWPEDSVPKPGYHEKDKVENYLREKVCDGSIQLVDAQQIIVSDWTKIYRRLQG